MQKKKEVSRTLSNLSNLNYYSTGNIELNAFFAPRGIEEHEALFCIFDSNSVISSKHLVEYSSVSIELVKHVEFYLKLILIIKVYVKKKKRKLSEKLKKKIIIFSMILQMYFFIPIEKFHR